MPNQHFKEEVLKNETSTVSNHSRRKFLNYVGLSASAVLLATSCKKEVNDYPSITAALKGGNGDDKPKNVVNLGSGDIGILNYA